MRSSGSTPNPRASGAPRLFIVLVGDDHPRACTGRRLLRWKRVESVPREGARTPPPVVLDPYAHTVLSNADRAAAVRGGLLVIDCSWNRLSTRGGFPTADSGVRSFLHHRRLPMLVATNPQHYGRVAQLNTVEAFAAALSVLGFPTEAAAVLSGFSGGEEFLTVNRDRLEAYGRTDGEVGMKAAEREQFGGV